MRMPTEAWVLVTNLSVIEPLGQRRYTFRCTESRFVLCRAALVLKRDATLVPLLFCCFP